MIVDAHAHIDGRGYRPDWQDEGFAKAVAAATGMSLEQVKTERLPARWDPQGDALVKEMDEAGIDKTVILVLDYGLVVPGHEPVVPIEEQNRLCYEAVKRHPERLIMGVGVDPRRPESARIVETGIREYGAKTIKLYPPAGFYPGDRVVYPIYETAVEYGVPVNFHTAQAFMGPLYSKYAHPIHLEDVAIDFPELRIHATHAGGGWWRDMLTIAEHRRNIYVDIGLWQLHLKHQMRFYANLRELVDVMGARRVMFASDWSGPRTTIRLAKWVQAIKQIPEPVRAAGIDFTEEEKTAILGANAARLLGIG